MEEALRIVTSGEVSHSQIGAFLAALRMKGVSCSELVGAARMLRRSAAFIDCGQREVVDVVGTGGDGSNSFNISTTSAFVAAGAGVTVAKHGNRAASSRCGSADVLAALAFLRAGGYREIRVVGRGVSLLVTAFACCAAPELWDSLVLEGAPASMRELVRKAVYPEPQSYAPRGMLRHFDLAELYAELAVGHSLKLS